MKFGTLKHLVPLLAVAVLAACGADPVASDTSLPLVQPFAAEADPSSVGTLSTLRPLQRLAPLDRDISASRTIGRKGGEVRIPEAGFTLVVPEGAVARNTRFVVTALAGSAVAYEFQPHGIHFAVPLAARQDLSQARHELDSSLRAGYFSSRSAVEVSGTSVQVSELIPGVTEGDFLSFRWSIEHFSGYIVAW